jgi:hypothetical protein
MPTGRGVPFGVVKIASPTSPCGSKGLQLRSWATVSLSHTERLPGRESGEHREHVVPRPVNVCCPIRVPPPPRSCRRTTRRCRRERSAQPSRSPVLAPRFVERSRQISAYFSPSPHCQVAWTWIVPPCGGAKDIVDGELEGWVPGRVGDQQRDEIAETNPMPSNWFCNRISVPADDASSFLDKA